jgi:pyruvate dehydrogenase E2 component (dihydrolipoamide acetyltransferase)
MPTNILMPALSPTMEEGGLSKWLVKEGDEVHAGDVIAEIETDKAAMEVEAYEDGKIGKIVVPAGTEGVKVNAVIAVLLGEGETMDAAQESAAKPSPGEGDGGERGKPAEGAAPAPSGEIAPSPQPSPRGGEGERAAPPVSANGAEAGHIFASPLARRLAKEAGLTLAAIHGSGPHGRIVEADVESAKAGGAPAVAGAAPAAMSDQEILSFYAPGSYDLVPHNKIRRIIAERLTQAKQTIPHFYLTADLEIDALLALRHEINGSAPTGEDGKPAYHLSLTDLIIKAMARALMDVPDANATWSESGMLRHKHADIGGLLTPVMHEAELKPLSEMSNEMKELERRARDRKLLPEEYRGGVTSISNLGMYAVREFAAVINPPQSSILAVGVGDRRPVARKDAVEIATVMTVTLSIDHRAVDGVTGAELLKAFAHYIEKPAGMLV